MVQYVNLSTLKCYSILTDSYHQHHLLFRRLTILYMFHWFQYSSFVGQPLVYTVLLQIEMKLCLFRLNDYAE